jgi:hypothetical protein
MILFVLQINYFKSEFPINERVALHLALTAVFFVSFFQGSMIHREYFNISIRYSVTILIAFSIVMWMFSNFSSFAIGVDDSYSIKRASGFATEPSNLAPLVSVGLGLSIFGSEYLSKTGRYYLFLLSAILILISFSPTVYFSSMVTILLLSVRTVFTSISGVILSFRYILIIGIIIFLVINIGLSIFPEEFQLQLNRLRFGIENIRNTGVGANSRMFIAIEGITYLYDKQLIWLGGGLGFDMLAGKMHHFQGVGYGITLPLFLIFSFGVFGLFLFFVLFVISYKRSNQSLVGMVAFIFVCCSIFNFGGIWTLVIIISLINCEYNMKSFKG